MKIANSSLVMQSSHDWLQQTSVKEKLHMWVDSPAPVRPPAAASQLSISPAAQQKQANTASAVDDGVQSVPNDPMLQLISQLIEKMTGLKVRIFDASRLNPPETAQAADPTPPPAPADSQPENEPPRAGYGLEYSKVSTYTESEQTSFQASGTIKTSDGKAISFNLNLMMQRQYTETSSTSILLGDAARKTDPLVISFNGGAAQLSDMRFSFDLNMDGKTEQINTPVSGGGFLALDKNGDGKINNGGELFGPGTGNGFDELAKYDSNHDGWIDENDPVFKQLKTWTKNADGSDSLTSLASSGAGAISLQAASTPFDIKTAANQLLGSVRASSVALKDDGTAGVVQQIDLTV